MEFLILSTLLLCGAFAAKSVSQGQRIALLASHVSKYSIEKLMESLVDGYLRALGEKDPGRRESIWNLQSDTENRLNDEFTRFCAGFAGANEADSRVSRLPVAVPFGERLFPAITFDLRRALAIHAAGIDRAIRTSPHRTPQARAFEISAELFLMQHTCHWFCKSKAVASARLLVRHQTSYEKALQSVSPETRKAYCALIAGG